MKQFLLVLILFVLTIPVKAQWSSDPHENLQLVLDEKAPQGWETEMLSDGSTVIYYTYSERMFIGDDTAFAMKHYLFRCDKDGKAVWDEPFLVSHAPNRTFTMVNKYLSVDANDNILISIPDTRYDTFGLRYGDEWKWWDMNVTCYKVSKDGEHLWGAEGVSVDKTPYELLALVNSTTLDNGDAIVCNVQQESFGMHTQITRISSDGNVVWSKPLLINGTPSGSYPTVINGGNNEFIVVYLYGSGIYAQKFDILGDEVWPHTAVYSKGGLASSPAQGWLRVMPLERGAFVSFAADPDGDKIESPYCSYINRDGQLVFLDGVDGTRLCYKQGLRGGGPECVYDKASNSVYCVWREFEPNYQSLQRIAAQRVSLTGELIWDAEGVEIAPLVPRFADYQNVQMGEDGKVLFSYLEQTNGQKDYAGYARYRSIEHGDSIWDTRFTWISQDDGLGYVYNKASLKMLPYKNGQWVTLWDDSRPGSGFTYSYIWGQNINSDGTLGVKADTSSAIENVVKTEVAKSFRVTANPIDNATSFVVENMRGKKAEISILNAMGKKVSTVFDGIILNDSQNVSWTVPAGISKGLYVAILTGGNRTETIKLIVK
ncbi:MAG: T9SS type A sorting domain-containing protein [Bacteroidales bacterium]|jgi:hypothetical protein|nr:T9SS type A sorting domain-containing protein [Bacteroidales bacterium]